MRETLTLLASVALAMVMACGVTLTVGTAPAQAAFPGTNGKIVFMEYNAEESDYGMKLINPSGSGSATLIESASVSDPAFSPSGMRVAYTKGTTWKNAEIYKINISNRRVTQITDNQMFDGDPAFSPDDTRVAFVRGERIQGSIKNTDIFVRSANGTGTTINLTNTPDDDEYAPAWSPDGKEIAFDTGGDIVVLNLESGQRRNLTNDGTAYDPGGRNDFNPNWSPDGTRIVLESAGFEEELSCYTSDRIYTVNAADGSDRRLLAHACLDESDDGSYFENPTYSPNGKQIAYVKTAIDYVYSRPKLFKMNASDGSNKQLVYDAYNPGPNQYPYGEDVDLDSPDWGVNAQR